MARRFWRSNASLLLLLALGACKAQPPGALSFRDVQASPRPAAVAAVGTPKPSNVAANAGAIAGTVLGPTAGLISNNLAAIVSGNTAALVANNGAGMISNNGSSLIGNNGSSYHLLDWTPTPAARALVSAVDGSGALLAGPVDTADDGSFKLSGLKPSGAVVFVRATYRANGVDVTLEAAVAAPRHADASGLRLDPATTLITKKAERLIKAGQLTETQLDPAALARAASALAPYLSPLAAAAGAALDAAQAGQLLDAMSTQSTALKAQLSQALGAAAAPELLAPAPVDASDTLPPQTNSSGGSFGGSSGSGGSSSNPAPTPTPLVQPNEDAGHAGGTLYFDGSGLSNAMVVTLPGGQTVNLTTSSAQRGSIVLPSGLSSGDLSISSGGQTFGPWVFHALAYALGAQVDGTTCDQTGAARDAATLTSARTAATAVRIGQYAYVIGGEGTAGDLDAVDRALINSDGTIGPFVALTKLQTARSQAACVVSGGYLYVLGGESGGAAIDSVERAAVNADGTLGSFAIVGHLTTPRAGCVAQRLGDGLYLIGGSGAGGALASIERAPIATDGTLGTFATTTVTLATPRANAGEACVGDDVYVFGGSNGSALSSVEQAPVNADGTLGAFATTHLPLNVARSAFATALVDHTLVVAGGDANGSVETATLQSNGTLGAFTTASGLTLPDARGQAASLTIDNRLYLLGGADPNASARADADSLGLVAKGNLGAFAASPNGLTTKRAYFGAVALGRYVYAIGGVAGTGLSDPIAAVERAQIGADGTLGTFSDAGITLSTRRSCFCLARVGARLYVIGGAAGDENAAPIGSVESAPIGADGTLGAFAAVAGVTLNVPRKKAAAVVLGNYLYVVGGDTGTSNDAGIATIERAPIHADGTLGAFTLQTGELTGPRLYHACAVLGGKLYVIGGQNNDGSSNGTVEAAPINADGTLGTFATVAGVTLAHARGEFATALVGPYLYAFCGWSSNGAILNTIERAPVGPDGSLGTFSACTGTTVAARDEGAAILTRDGVYLLGGDGLSSVERAPLQ